jgi:para-nitrobenzyl esterase
LTGSDPSRFALSDKMSKAWVAFAKTSNPSHDGLPEWKSYTLNGRATMLFDNECLLVNDARREDRMAFDGLPIYRP